MPSPNPAPRAHERPLRAWSPVLALIGMLAVLLGVQASRLEVGRSPIPSAHTAPLPELRALTPTPELEGGVPPALPPAPLQVLGLGGPEPVRLNPINADLPRPSLALLGRRQVEGG